MNETSINKKARAASVLLLSGAAVFGAVTATSGSAPHADAACPIATTRIPGAAAAATANSSLSSLSSLSVLPMKC